MRLKRITFKISNNCVHLLQACKKTCYQLHVVQYCNCTDSDFPNWGTAIDHVTGGSDVKVRPCKNDSEGLFNSQTPLTSLHFYLEKIRDSSIRIPMTYRENIKPPRLSRKEQCFSVISPNHEMTFSKFWRGYEKFKI